MDYLKRQMEATLIQCRKTFPVTLLTGPRQVGKSTTLQMLFPEVPYVTFDDPLQKRLAKTDPRLFFADNPFPLILDEVQGVSEVFPLVKLLSDQKRENGLFFLTGSQQFHLMKNITESLAGRVAVLELQGLSFRELAGVDFHPHFVPTTDYLEARGRCLVKYEGLWNRIHRGFYPALLNESLDWDIFYRSYLNTYLERDISDLLNVKDKGKFLSFLVAAAARTAQVLNYANIADEIGVSLETVRNWISLLETSGILYLLEPFAPSALKRAIKTPKLYFRDTGLVCYLTKWTTPDVLRLGAMNGAIFETFVVSEILKTYANEGKGYRDHVFFYRGKDKTRKRADGSQEPIDSEIDLILEENGILYPVEIKMTASPDASMASAFAVLDGVPDKKRGTGVLLCLCDRRTSLRENLVALPVEFI